MLITRRLPNGDYEAEAFGTGIRAQAATLEDAEAQVGAAVAMKNFAAFRLKMIRRATTIAFDPREGCYIADMPAAGITARGFTRNDAWERLLYGLRLADQARAAAATQDGDAGAEPDTDASLLTEPLEQIDGR